MDAKKIELTLWNITKQGRGGKSKILTSKTQFGQNCEGGGSRWYKKESNRGEPTSAMSPSFQVSTVLYLWHVDTYINHLIIHPLEASPHLFNSDDEAMKGKEIEIEMYERPLLPPEETGQEPRHCLLSLVMHALQHHVHRLVHKLVVEMGNLTKKVHLKLKIMATSFLLVLPSARLTSSSARHLEASATSQLQRYSFRSSTILRT